MEKLNLTKKFPQKLSFINKRKRCLFLLSIMSLICQCIKHDKIERRQEISVKLSIKLYLQQTLSVQILDSYACKNC